MKIVLTHRHWGIHDVVDETQVPGPLGDYATRLPDQPNDLAEWWSIDEDKLLAAIPDGFLPCPPRRILLGVGDKDGWSAQAGLKRFQSWAKYFDAYMVTLYDEEAAP